MKTRWAYFCTFPQAGLIERNGSPLTYSRRSTARKRRPIDDPHSLGRIVRVDVYGPGEHPNATNGMVTYVVHL